MMTGHESSYQKISFHQFRHLQDIHLLQNKSGSKENKNYLLSRNKTADEQTIF